MTETRSTWFGRGRTRALLSAGLLLGAGAVATSAYWTSSAKVTGTTITAGAMNIDLANDVAVKPETYTWSGLNLAGMTAGSTAAAVLKVSNNSTGALTFSYRVQAAATNASGLGGALRLTVLSGGTVSGSTCTGGTAIGSGGATLNGFDQPAAADLAPGQSASLCVQVGLPTGTGVAAGSTSTVTFTFPATQVHS
ncbi:MAG: SipW-dependent-type signal peptide-containing protein [Nocardioidaceae bacterium]|nr:SipW-dependent-type signal peptide-containing protein [Nocardioidaceae bacterium]MCL2612214.1 SipW-dependent-type signal peptide-containing protein [Nocardioidaceae bacterium]